MYVVKIAHAVSTYPIRAEMSVMEFILAEQLKLQFLALTPCLLKKKCYFLMPVCLLTEGLCYICRMQF